MLTWGQKSNLKNALRTQHFSRISGNQVRLRHVGKRCLTFCKTFCNTRGNCGHSSGFNTPGGAVPPARSPCWPAMAWHRLLGLHDIYVAWWTHNHKVHVFVYCSALIWFYEWCKSLFSPDGLINCGNTNISSQNWLCILWFVIMNCFIKASSFLKQAICSDFKWTGLIMQLLIMSYKRLKTVSPVH